MLVFLRHLRKAVVTLVPRRWFRCKQTSCYISSLPPEICLICFSYMTVETLIASRSVCSSWRRLLPHAENAIHPVRLRLYKLYLTIIDNPKPDPRSQRYIRRKLKKKKKFNREAYIRHLQGQNLAYATRVPEECQIWVLEWPAKLVINGLWPGLPFAECYMDTAATGGSSLRYGVNYIAVKPAPKLDRIVASYTEQEEDNRIWALPLWSTCWDKDSFLDRWCHDYEYRWRDREAPLVSRRPFPLHAL